MIDWTRITDLERDLGPDSFAEVVALFLSEVDTALSGLAPGGDRAQLGPDLHFLKGAGLNLGFQDFAALCQIGETQAALGQADQVDLAAIVACFRLSYVQFRAQMAQRNVA